VTGQVSKEQLTSLIATAVAQGLAEMRKSRPDPVVKRAPVLRPEMLEELVKGARELDRITKQMQRVELKVKLVRSTSTAQKAMFRKQLAELVEAEAA
jgi:hypothetical protein